jgi:cytochrome-b5 reductase
VRLIFANRTPADVMLKDELDALAVRFPNFKVLYTVDDAAGGAWGGKTGHVSRDMVADFLPPPQKGAGRHKLLVCGPPPMVAAVRASPCPSFPPASPRCATHPCASPPRASLLRACRSAARRKALSRGR